MELGERIRQERKKHKLTLQQVGDVFGISRSSVSDWESGKTRPDQDKLPGLATLFGITVDDLLSKSPGKRPVIDESKSSQTRTLSRSSMAGVEIPAEKLPVISWTQAGHWSEIVNNLQAGGVEEWVVCPFPDSEFVLKVPGQSMHNPGGDLSFRDGEFLSVSTKVEPQHLSLVVVKRDNEASAIFRQLLIENDGVLILQTLNTSWPERYIKVDEHVQLIGVVTGQWRPLL
jgi:SOS-response transcriptional repressor LexA